jgi:hypothetical protein
MTIALAVLLVRTVRFALRLTPAAVMTALLIAAANPPAAAVNIVVDYDETDRPSFDPNGDKLMTMMAWVEAYYENILITKPFTQFPPTFDIEVWWDDLPDGNGTTTGATLARTEFNPFEVDIVFDTKIFGVERNWFFDETPIDNSEFMFAENLGTTSSVGGFGQTLFRDLSPADQQAGFAGSPHGVLEVGYSAAARSGGPADGRFDLWSTALHEMGHVMGIRSEVIDDDNNFEFIDSQHGGVAAEMREDPDSDGHVAAGTALMCAGCGDDSVRRLPSAADLLMLSKEIGNQNLNIPRVDFLGNHGSSWDEPLNWIGGRVPSTFNEVFVRNGTPATMAAGFNTARNMFVYENSSVAINGDSELKVFHELRVGSLNNGTSGQVHVGNLIGTPWLEVETLNIDNGLVNLNSQGAVLVSHGPLRVKRDGTLMGAGQVEVQGELNNDGEISAGAFLLLGFGGDLYLRAIDNGKLDLDGGQELVLDPGLSAFAFPGFPGQFDDEHGRINAVNGNLRVVSPLADSFNGTATIGAGRTMHFFQPWGLGGNLVMRGGATAANAAVLTGAEIQFGGTTTVEEGVATIDAPLVSGPFTRINVRPAARLNLITSKLGPASNPLEYQGGLTLDSGATLNVDVPGTTWTLKKSLTMAPGASVVGDNIVNRGRIQGAGDLAVAGVDNSGVVAPALELRVPGGLYNQSSSGRLEMDLAGLAQAVNFDVLRAGTAQLAGTLAITLADTFLPAAGTAFDILTAGQVSGAFSNLELNFPSDVKFNGHLVYASNKVSFLVTQAKFNGDFDNDGDVDGDDLLAWTNASKAGGLGLPGDADGDSDADGTDFLTIQRQMGRRVASLPSGGGGAGGGGGGIGGGIGGIGGIGGGGIFRATPEPASLYLALGALMMTIATRRGRPFLTRVGDRCPLRSRVSVR